MSASSAAVHIAADSVVLDGLRCEKRLAIVPGASHLFEEPETSTRRPGCCRVEHGRKLVAQVAVGDDADEIAVSHDGKLIDAVFLHRLSGVQGGILGFDGDDGALHSRCCTSQIREGESVILPRLGLAASGETASSMTGAAASSTQ